MAGRITSVSPSATEVPTPPTEVRSTGWILIVDIGVSRLASARGRAERLVVGEDAHLLVGDLVGRLRADRALGVAADLELGERRAQRFVEQQTADQRLAGA